MHLIRHRVHCEVSKGIADDSVPIGDVGWVCHESARNVFVYEMMPATHPYKWIYM